MNKLKIIRGLFAQKYASRIIFLGPKRYCEYIFFQRILRINSHVSWPVHWSSTVTHPKKIKQKSELPYLGHHFGCYIQANNGIEVGLNLRYGPNVHIISANHDLDDYEKHPSMSPIIIGDNCWIGAGSILLPGVVLANHVVVAAGSVVTKSFTEDNVLIGGTPARVIKHLNCYKGKYNGIER